MARPFSVDQDVVDFANDLVDNATTADDLKRALSITLSSDLGLDASQVAAALHLSLRSVFRYRSDLTNICEGADDPREDWGGRRNSIFSEDEEQNFLSEWYDMAIKGEIISIYPIHNKLIQKIGYNIPLSTTYRMLQRNGWRKVKPDTQHPKKDPLAQEEFKKKSLSWWSPSIKKEI